MLETHPYGNFIPLKIKYLLLGSFTAKGYDTDPDYDWFYGSKRNQFWPIISEVYQVKLTDRASKEILFTKLHLGIADIIYKCERSQNSSLDANLINIVYNPELNTILMKYKLQKIYFSSRFVENQYRKVFKRLVLKFPETELITLPSPSPRYAQMSKSQKICRYRELLPILNV